MTTTNSVERESQRVLDAPLRVGDIDTTEQILRETAQPANLGSEKIVCGDPNAKPNDFVGYGIVDAFAAVKRAMEMR